MINTIVGAILTFILGLISKQLADIKKNRALHQEAYENSMNEIKDIKKSISEIQKEQKESGMRTARYRIIRFDDEEQQGISHTDDHWDDILESCDVYSAFCFEHPEFKNHKGQAAMKRIVTANQKGRNRHNI